MVAPNANVTAMARQIDFPARLVRTRFDGDGINSHPHGCRKLRTVKRGIKEAHVCLRQADLLGIVELPVTRRIKMWVPISLRRLPASALDQCAADRQTISGRR
jgi:hypothetical protein